MSLLYSVCHNSTKMVSVCRPLTISICSLDYNTKVKCLPLESESLKYIELSPGSQQFRSNFGSRQFEFLSIREGILKLWLTLLRVVSYNSYKSLEVTKTTLLVFLFSIGPETSFISVKPSTPTIKGSRVYVWDKTI